MRKSQQQRSDESRHRILEAAIREFSEKGLAGARTGNIAAAAQVNKALLYYYFSDKEALYTAALEAVASQVAESAKAVLEMPCSAGERMLRFALQHFDRIVSQQAFQALMQQEMIRFHEGRGGAMHILAKRAFEPMFTRVEVIAREGIRSSELCDVDWMQMIYSVLGANVFCLLSAPMVRLIAAKDPLEPAALVSRRRSAIEFLGQSLFVNREHGARLAKKVLAETPLPQAVIPGRRTA